MAIAEIIGSIFSGGVTGLIGAGITAFVEFKKQKLMFEHEVKMEELNQKTMQMEIEGQLRIAETEAEAAINVADAETLAKSYDADRAAYTNEAARTGILFKLVDFVRGMIRPVLTIYLAVIVSLLYWNMQGALGDVSTLNPNDLMSLYREVVLSIIYVATTVILWWFGTRNKIGHNFSRQK
jgi:hypothetical protein